MQERIRTHAEQVNKLEDERKRLVREHEIEIQSLRRQNDDLRESFTELLRVQSSGFDIIKQHSECLFALKAVIKHKSHPTCIIKQPVYSNSF